MAQPDRPLSPHLGIYRWQISNGLSIIHRMTGLTLTLGAVVLTAWLLAAASGPDTYRFLAGLLRSPVGMLLLLGLSFCFFYHLCNGIRHLFWDAGHGFEIPRSNFTGRMAVLAAVILTVVFWIVALSGPGG
ncbi:succinate dehydrogenase / fumarate reductase, cytochrome b subunit [Gammaproteobacteria bacterium]|nr:succinate dehydrogenase / fumarate reductase, cytochrome b subunit [Gammaproteobacteria bacterium]